MLRGGLQAAPVLRHFTHTVSSARYEGYFRPLALDCIEVTAVGLIRTIALCGRSPIDVAREALEEFLLIRQHLGWPIVESDEISAQAVEHPSATVVSTDTA
jgi:hypothetical protein